MLILKKLSFFILVVVLVFFSPGKIFAQYTTPTPTPVPTIVDPNYCATPGTYGCEYAGDSCSPDCTGATTYCNSDYLCAISCLNCPLPGGNTCAGTYTWCADQCDDAGFLYCECTTDNTLFQIIPCPTPTPVSGGGTPTPTPTPIPTPTPTPVQIFAGNFYADENAVPAGIGGTDNLCTGITTTPAFIANGLITLDRIGETKSSSVNNTAYTITANTSSSDYTIALELEFPPADPDNAWMCACNADPSNPFRCLYTNQQPNQGLTNFFVKRNAVSNSWFQTLGGSSWASGNIQSKIPFSTCSLPTCNPALILRDPLGTINSAGFPLTDTGSVVTSDGGGVYIHEVDGRTNALQAEALGVKVPLENYDYFYNKFGQNAQTLSNSSKPIVTGDTLGVFLYSGNLVINEINAWNLNNTEQIIVFVNGNLTIDDSTGGQNRIITVATGGDGFLMFVVSGDTTVTAKVGYNNIYTSAATANIANVEGIFVSDGLLTIAGLTGATDKKFIGAGTFVGWSGVDLQRNFDDGLTPELNSAAATETFIFRPDFIINAPRQIKTAQMTWREIEPSF
ncbi:MAG: hypothetical protein ABII10_01935 [Candidatus Paceibacterota bacterium]